MRWRLSERVQPFLSWLLAGLLLLLLAILATLQYRWIGALSESERSRAQEALEQAARDFARDFDRLLSELYLAFLPPPGEPTLDAAGVAARLAAWRAAAPHPSLVAAVYEVRFEPDATPSLARLEPAAGRFAPAAWPEELEPLRRQLAGRGPWRRRGPGQPPAPGPPAGAAGPFFLLDPVPALVVPSFDGLRGRRLRSRGRRGLEVELLVVVLDRATLEGDVLPRLVARHFSARREGPQPLAIVRREDPRQVIFSHPPGAPPPRAGARAPLFALLPPDELAPPEPGADGRRLWPHPTYRALSRSPARWQLVAGHPAGSLEAAVAANRRRNLAVGLGILGVLGASVVLLALAMRRAQRLARQQLDFVAGVSHELMTPLAAMRSAGQNLADGVVTEAEQVRRYGALVEREGRRLSALVEQILAYAGMRAGRVATARRPVAPAAVVEEAMESCRPLFEERGMAVEVEVDDGLPPIDGDPTALRRALQNLLANAAKYAASGGWVGVRASAANGGRDEVRLAVADRGPGIAPADRPRLFEPFYRGAGGAAGAAGSGLGLSLVKQVAEAHGGRVTVDSRPGHGSVFTLHLPARREAA